MATEARQITITDLLPEHWPEVARIYEEGIVTGDATFETSVPSWEAWNGSHLDAHRFVALDDGAMLGWVAVSSVSDRCVYGGVVEHSVYVAEQGARPWHRLGAAPAARSHSTEAAGVWTIQTGIFPENDASVRLHDRRRIRNRR